MAITWTQVSREHAADVHPAANDVLCFFHDGELLATALLFAFDSVLDMRTRSDYPLIERFEWWVLAGKERDRELLFRVAVGSLDADLTTAPFIANRLQLLREGKPYAD